MSQNHLIKLACTKCKEVNYYSTRNKKKVEKKVELSKYCNSSECRGKFIHKEAKK